MTERFTARVAAYLLLIRDGRALFTRRFNTGYQDGMHMLPSGHVEAEETPVEAIIRETAEEVGVIINPNDLAMAHVMARLKASTLNDKPYIDFCFVCSKWEGEPRNCEPEKCDELVWLPLDNLPDTVVPYIHQVIASWQQGNSYSEFAN